jgi:geranylgeranyl pyrophosphate synthase
LASLGPWRLELERWLAEQHATAHGALAPQRLREAMEHTLLASGKRMRPLLVLASASAARAHVSLPLTDDELLALCRPACLAVELVHSYSLIHDDLPALDNDSMRRGRPTVHVAYDEATAVLAGDALLTDAFFHLAGAELLAAEQVRTLAGCIGSAGMVGGQYDDMRAERTMQTLPDIHRRKTAFLIAAACELGALAVGATALRSLLSQFGLALGLAFQVWDDVLDVSAKPGHTGKGTGRDAKDGKPTYVSLLGLDAARAQARQYSQQAVEHASALGAQQLVGLARFAVERDR